MIIIVSYFIGFIIVIHDYYLKIIILSLSQLRYSFHMTFLMNFSYACRLLAKDFILSEALIRFNMIINRSNHRRSHYFFDYL